MKSSDDSWRFKLDKAMSASSSELYISSNYYNLLAFFLLYFFFVKIKQISPFWLLNLMAFCNRLNSIKLKLLQSAYMGWSCSSRYAMYTFKFLFLMSFLKIWKAL